MKMKIFCNRNKSVIFFASETLTTTTLLLIYFFTKKYSISIYHILGVYV